MRPILFLAAVMLFGCERPDAGDTDTDTPIEPGTETVSASWDVDMFTLYESPTLPAFDTQDGARELLGMTIAIDHEADITISVENGSPFPLEADDYELQFYFNTITQLGAVNDPSDSPPFFGPGSFDAQLSADLPAGDQDEQTEGTVVSDTFHREIHFEAHYDPIETPTYLDAMVGEEPITVVVGGFSEYWVEWIDDHGGEAFLYGGNSALHYAGTMTVTYEYGPATP